MTAIPDTARLSSAVTRLREETQRTSDRIVATAYVARQLGATAEAYEICAQQLDRQANRAGELQLGWAVEASRAVAVEKRLIADALEALENRKDF